MKIKNLNLILSIQMILLLLLVFTGTKEFSLWAQVTILWLQNFPIQSVLSHPHGVRYLLVLPIFELSELLSVDFNFIFSITGVFLISLTYYLICKTITSQGSLSNFIMLMIAILITFLSLFMNGRIIFALLGSAILVNLLFKQTYWYSFYTRSFTAIFLSSVSSGTFTVSLLWFVYIWFFFRKKNNLEIHLFGGGIFFVLYILKDFIIMYIMKNINYFGGGVEGVITMLKHGFGRFLMLNGDSLVVILILLVSITSVGIAFIYLVGFKYMLNTFNLKVIGVIVIGGGMGMFGFSTALYSLPLFIAIIAISFERLNAHSLVDKSTC